VAGAAVYFRDATAAETMAALTVDSTEGGCEPLLARVRTPALEKQQANPYRRG
jgi:hypothetical protein